MLAMSFQIMVPPIIKVAPVIHSEAMGLPSAILVYSIYNLMIPKFLTLAPTCLVSSFI